MGMICGFAMADHLEKTCICAPYGAHYLCFAARPAAEFPSRGGVSIDAQLAQGWCAIMKAAWLTRF